jgi:DUF438 domain-containing protein
MRLLNPSPGEVVDRLTILELKIQAANRREVSDVHFQVEKVQLEEYLSRWDREIKKPSLQWEKIQESWNGLVAVNGLLWMAEDQIRETVETEAFTLARLCKQVANLNDHRSQLVQKISEAYGEKVQPEKMYAEKKAVPAG